MYFLAQQRHISRSIFWSKNQASLQNIFVVMAGVLLMAIASQLVIPLVPVPLTFQSSTAVLIGMACGARLGATIILTYIIAGVCGLPIFAEFSAGPTVLFGPTAGYLLGFLPAALVSGYLAERGGCKNIFLSLLTASIGTSIVFLFGVLFLSHFAGFENAIKFGLLPFIASEACKIAAASVLAPRFWQTK